MSAGTESKITIKSSKNEILEAYHRALDELQEKKLTSQPDIKKEQEKKERIKEASQYTAEDIVSHLANLKLEMVKSLETVERQLLNEQKKLTTLQQAIDIQSKDLEDLYEIKVNADTLGALLQAQAQKAEDFEKDLAERQRVLEAEIAKKSALWKQEQEEKTAFWREQEAQQKKLRQREEEEYSYKRDLERQKERDQYLAQKQALEKELVDKRTQLEQEFSDREEKLLAQEEELKNLREEVNEFPKRLQKAMSETEKTITDRLKFQYDYESKLAQKEIEGERKLYEQKIADLGTKITQQAQHIQALTEKANQAGTQVQEIALKAIEGAANQRFYHATSGYIEKPTNPSGKT